MRDSSHQLAKQHLRQLISALAARNERRLPAEEELSKQLGVSRSTLRTALLSLQKEGVLQRVHGVGTFVNQNTLGIKANITHDRPFIELLAQNGYEPSVRSLSIRTERLAQPRLGRLQLDTNEEQVCLIERLFEASGQPAVIAFDYVPLRYLTAPLERVQGESSIFTFARQWCGRKIIYSVADIIPTLPEPRVEEVLRIPPTEPLLLLDHIHVAEGDQPVALTRAFVHSHYLRFSVVRTGADV